MVRSYCLSAWHAAGMELERSQRAVLEHVRSTFDGHSVDVVTWPIGPMESRVPGFAIARVAPGPRLPGLWGYVSLGCWGATHDHGHGLEFILLGPSDDARLIELATINAYYHCGPVEQRLDVGHSVPIGEPWLPGSECDHLLISLPYPIGAEFEVCVWDGGHARILWALPITEGERNFKREHGLELLEQQFDDVALKYWVVDRSSVV